MDARKPVRLTPQQRSLVKYLAKGMNLTDAALAAGYSEECPAQSGHQALEHIKRKMPQILDRHGLTDDALIDKYLRPALEANETKFAQFEGHFTDRQDVIAWGPRLNALDMAFNLKGSYAPKETKNDGQPVAVQFLTNVSFARE